jgi:phosphoglucomutase
MDSLSKAKAWCADSLIDRTDREEIQKLIDSNNLKEIEERFYRDLEFGTGGLRSILGQGTNRMNKYNVRRATQALCQVVKSENPKGAVAISYDSRRFSKEFAQEVASVVAGNGLTAYLYSRMNPVCLLSFSTRYHKATAGVMVTASHNPPEYNGYKVFWADGAQVTPPYDQKIIDAYYAQKSLSEIQYTDFEKGLKEKKIVMVGEDVENAYFKAIYQKVLNPKLCNDEGSKLKIVYTPIHGTGLVPCEKALRDCGFSNLFIVPEQAQPDGNFPTVKSPNPENPDALALAVELMKKEKADLVFGTDPDTDRLGVALIKNNKVEYLNGNQIGTLMLHYILSTLKSSGTMPKNPYMVKTIVTTRLQDKMGKHFGIEVFNTLTGFKWICGKMNQLEKTNPEKNFIFGTEESFGYLNHPYVRDKDGVSSVILMSEVALFHKTQGHDLIDALDSIYEEFGFYYEGLLSLDYFGKEGAEKIGRIMEYFRTKVKANFAGEKVALVEDYQSQKVFDLKSDKVSELDTPKSNVLGYQFESSNVLYLRPSGTEPKIKFYIMTNASVGSLTEKKAKALAVVDHFIKEIKKTCLDI